MLGPGGFRLFTGQRDDSDLAVMRTEGAEFARRLAEQDPPGIDSHTATIGTLKQLHPDVDDRDEIVADDVATEYVAAHAAAAEAKGLLA